MLQQNFRQPLNGFGSATPTGNRLKKLPPDNNAEQACSGRTEQA